MVLCMTGIGSGSAPLAQCVDLASRPGRAQQWRRCKHLIIDEISMVESTYFDKLEAVARAVRKKGKYPIWWNSADFIRRFLTASSCNKTTRTQKVLFSGKKL